MAGGTIAFTKSNHYSFHFTSPSFFLLRAEYKRYRESLCQTRRIRIPSESVLSGGLLRHAGYTEVHFETTVWSALSGTEAAI